MPMGRQGGRASRGYGVRAKIGPEASISLSRLGVVPTVPMAACGQPSEEVRIGTCLWAVGAGARTAGAACRLGYGLTPRRGPHRRRHDRHHC